MEYSNAIRQYRKNNCLSQKEFADMIGVKYNTICRWETENTSHQINLKKN